jgi:CRP-like cAMP-binding protein
MKEFIKIIKNAPIFKGVSEKEIESMLVCLNAKQTDYNKDQFIIRVGDSQKSIGLLLSGSALVIHEDYWGNRNIMTKLSPPDLFAEAFACSPEVTTNVSVIAQEDCSVLWLDVGRILTTCPTACAHHNIMIRNLLSAIASKNLTLNEKLTHIEQRTTKEKVLSYLSSQAQKQNSREFDITFNRQQLADYLSVERSALSAELSKLQSEGMIEFNKNHFILK